MKDPASARDDLAFIRGLVNDGGRIQASTGSALLAGGLCYGTQCLVQFLLAQLPPASPVQQLGEPIAGILPTLIFIVILTRITMRDRRNAVGAGGTVATRALKAGFSAVGASAIVTALIFGTVATQERNFTIWLFHPIMVCVGQGVAWYLAYAIRRRRWFLAVSMSWFACSLLLTALLHHLFAFILVVVVALYALMALPGWVLLRTARAG